MFLESCVPYSQETCLAVGKRLNLDIGSNFAGDYSTKGCYAYGFGTYDGKIYYGTGGTTEGIQEPVTAPQYRPKGYDCEGNNGGT